MSKQTTFDIFNDEEFRQKIDEMDNFDEIVLDPIEVTESYSDLSLDTDELLQMTSEINISSQGVDSYDNIIIDDFNTIEIPNNEKKANFSNFEIKHTEQTLTEELGVSSKVVDDEINDLKIDTTFSEVEVQVVNEEYLQKQVNDSLEAAFRDVNVIENNKSEEIKIAIDEQISNIQKNEFGKVNILVIGIGGCGCNAVDRMYNDKVKDIQLIAIDTSEQTLQNISADHKLLIGEREFAGHGSGSNVSKVEIAFEAAKPKIQAILENVDMVFVAGAIGNGTGSVGLCRVGQYAREMGILTLGFATLPRSLETDGIIVKNYFDIFLESVDSTVIIENDKIFNSMGNQPIKGAMLVADSMLIDGIRGIYELITKPGKINLDYADIKTAFKNQGAAIMGIGYGSGENAVINAINESIKSDIVDIENIRNAQTIIFNITCPPRSVTIDQASRGTDLIYSLERGNSIKHLFFGYSYDETLEDEVKVTFIATGTERPKYVMQKPTITTEFSLGQNPNRIKRNNANVNLDNLSLFGNKTKEVPKKVENTFKVVEEDPLFKDVKPDGTTKKPDFFKR